MVPKCIIAVVLALYLTPLAAQSSQQGVLLQQIAALRVYSGYLQKGYKVVKNGLNTIGDLKNGEMNLHSDYFTSLGLVNEMLSGSVTVSKIIVLQERILHCSTADNVESAFLSAEESAYCRGVKEHLLKSCLRNMETLYETLTNDSLEMDDAQRLKTIEGIYQEMQDSYAFARHFDNEIRLLTRERKRIRDEVEKTRKLHNIN